MNIAIMSAHDMLVPPNQSERHRETATEDLMDHASFFDWWSDVEVEMDYIKDDVYADAIARCHIHYSLPHIAVNAVTVNGEIAAMSTNGWLCDADMLFDPSEIFNLAGLDEHGGDRELDRLLSDYDSFTLAFRKGVVVFKTSDEVYTWM